MFVRQRSHKIARLFLLDFLAPSLVSRSNTVSTVAPHAASRKLARKPPRRPKLITTLSDVSSATTPAELLTQIKRLTSPNARRLANDGDLALLNTTLVQLRKALEARDMDSVWELWCVLDAKELLQYLGPANLEEISRLLSTNCPAPGSKEPWSPSHRDSVEEIALVAAAGGAVDALKTCMILYIKRNDPKSVLNLYDKFSDVSEQGWANDDNEHMLDITEDSSETTSHNADGDSNDLALDQPLTEEPFRYVPGRGDIRLAVITAHAMLDSFQDALQVSLKSEFRFRHFTVKDFLKNLAHDPPLQDKVSLYIRNIDTARLVARPTSFSRQISNLSKSRALPMLEKLYRSVLEGFTGPYAYLASNTESVTPERPIVMPESGWSSFILGFLFCRRLDLTEELWDVMMDVGVSPGVALWNSLLEGYSEMGAVERVMGVWNTMPSQGVQRDAFSYRALISALCKAQQPEEARKHFEGFQIESKKTATEDSLALLVHNTFLHGLLINSREKEALDMLKKMRKDGPQPDIISYNTLMRFYGKRGDMKPLANVLRSIKAIGIVPDATTFSTVLTALLKAGRPDAPKRMLAIMDSMGVQHSVATYSAMIDSLVREKGETNLKSALALLTKMEASENTKPNEVTYTAILAGFQRDHTIDPREVEQCTQDILRRMEARGVRPNRVMYHVLIKASLENPNPEGLRDALKHHRELVRRGIPMAHDTWYVLLQGLVKRGEWAIANEMTEKLHFSGFEPMWRVAELVAKIRRRNRRKMEEGPGSYF